MSKEELAFCKECDCYTKFLKLGKPKRTREEVREKVEEAVCTLGIFPLIDFLSGTGDDRHVLWKCTKCGKIFED